jgi:hypothetical protein
MADVANVRRPGRIASSLTRLVPPLALALFMADSMP